MPISPPLTIALTVLGTIAVGVPVASFAQPVAVTSALATAPLASAATELAAVPTPEPAKNPGAPAKLRITALDAGPTVTAQFNPGEITLDKSVPWKKATTATSDQPELTFTSAEGRTMSFELLFDGTASNTDVEKTYVAKLTQLAKIMDPSPSAPEAKKRPSRVRVSWGQGLVFDGVIASLDVSYTKFAPNGTPLKASAKVKIEEASGATFKRP
jgi:hypothetical protein